MPDLEQTPALAGIALAMASALISSVVQLYAYARGRCDYALGLKRSIFWLARPLFTVIALLLGGIALKIIAGVDLIGDALAGVVIHLCIYSALACLIAALVFVIGSRMIPDSSDSESAR